MKIDISEETFERLTALQTKWGQEDWPSIDGLLSHIIERWHAVYVQPRPEKAEGWELRDDLSLEDLEEYWTSLLGEARQHATNRTDSIWSTYGRYIRAAVKAGWVISPEITLNKKGRLEPSLGRDPEKLSAIMTLIDRHYTKLMTEGNDPNS